MTEQSPGGWCTNWSAFNVESIWQMVEGEGADDSWEQVHRWADIESVVNGHSAWLAAFQAEVERVWPSSGAASAAFGTQINVLKANMEQTVIAAGRTKHALDSILNNLNETKAKIAEVRGDYAEASDDLVIRQIDGAEDELNDKARRIMADSENVVRQHTVSIVAPPEFLDPGIRTPKKDDGPEGPKGAGGASGAGSVGALIPPVPHNPPAPIAGVDPMMPDGKDWLSPVVGGSPSDSPGGTGPALSGAITSPAIDPARTTVNPTVAPGAPATGSSHPAGMLPGLSGPGIGGGAGVIGGPPRGGTTPFALTPTAGRPVNGVIGGAGGSFGGRGTGVGASGGGAGIGSVGRGAGASGAGRDAGAGSRTSGLPNNGVIGGAPAGTRPAAGRGPSGISGATGSSPSARPTSLGQAAGLHPASGRRRESGPEQDSLHWDPDNPWEVAEGGPAVIEPDLRDHRHDAGPGVIGAS
ncbi:hypothetical protein [Actinoplanes sp. NPDC051859]|uniref:hypothetical protein n=1 Tax=Actinoplanes sp. NPDC051859 TaxID=3363909 RepID=UPI0037914E90